MIDEIPPSVTATKFRTPRPKTLNAREKHGEADPHFKYLRTTEHPPDIFIF